MQRKKNEDKYLELVQKYYPERSHTNWIQYSYQLAKYVQKECDSAECFLKRFDNELSKSTNIRTTISSGFRCISNPKTVLEVYY